MRDHPADWPAPPPVPPETDDETGSPPLRRPPGMPLPARDAMSAPLTVVTPPALTPRDVLAIQLRALISELAWFTERNHLTGEASDDDGFTDAQLADRLSDYVLATEAVRNLAAAIRDLRESL